MCRLVVFSGLCTTCRRSFTWDELTQELSCLEAKNYGAFGECKRGAAKDEHAFDQECDECAEEACDDEGVGMDDTVEASASTSTSTNRDREKERKGEKGKGKSKGKGKEKDESDDERQKKKQRIR